LARVPIVLRPTAPVAADALLPGDPGRALALAQGLLGEPRMSNHAHGLWGYSGETAAGRPLTIQAIGIGAPSAAIVLRDLAELGVRRTIGIGTCVGLAAGLTLGETLVCERALAADGTSRALGTGDATVADAGLARALRAAAGTGSQVATVASADVLHGGGSGDGIPAARRREWLDAGAVAAEMQAAALFALGARVGVAVAWLLVVTDLDSEHRDRIGEAELESASLDAATVAASALSAG
jgi:uridine phosphorylase